MLFPVILIIIALGTFSCASPATDAISSATADLSIPAESVPAGETKVLMIFAGSPAGSTARVAGANRRRTWRSGSGPRSGRCGEIRRFHAHRIRIRHFPRGAPCLSPRTRRRAAAGPTCEGLSLLDLRHPRALRAPGDACGLFQQESRGASRKTPCERLRDCR